MPGSGWAETLSDILNQNRISIRINNKNIDDVSSAYIIAELSANHNQDFDLAVKTLHAIRESGADAVKVQTFTPDSMTLDLDNEMFRTRADTIWAGQKLYDLYRKAALPYEWHPKLKAIANNLKLDFFSTPFDIESADFLEKLDVPAYKIASLEITDIPLIEHIAGKGKPVLFSTGIASLDDIKLALGTCRQAGNTEIALLKCTSAYPTPLEDVNLLNIPTLKETFKTVVGLSDHTLTTTIPVAAFSLGARIIEKHFILDRSIGGPDAGFSLEPEQFREMVHSVREIEKAMGSKEYIETEKMKSARRSRRSIFIVKDIRKGEKLTLENIRPIRPGYGLHPKYYMEILGKKAAIDLKRGMPLRLEDIE